MAIFLLIVHCALADPALDEESRASGSLPDLSSGQDVREFGRPIYRSFTRRDEGIVSRIISAAEDWRGLMIFGSVNCALEYDGQHWASVPIPNAGWISGLARDARRTIWVGRTGELGRLAFDGGTYRYESFTAGSIWAFSSFSGRLFVHAKHKPLCEVVGDHLVPMLDDPMLRETTVIAAIELKDKILLVTRDRRL